MKKRIAPAHAMAFARPVKLNYWGRKQVGATFAVRRYVGSFKAKGLKGLELAKAIVEDVEKFRTVELPEGKARMLWARRRPREIIKTRKIFAGPLKEKSYIMGCNDTSQALVSAFRAAGFKAVIARERVHTYVKILLKEKNRYKVFKVDLVSEQEPIREINADDLRREQNLGQRGKFAEGQSLADIGIRSYEDFFKYWPVAEGRIIPRRH